MSEELDLEHDADLMAGYSETPTETPEQLEADFNPPEEIAPVEPKYRQITEDEFNDLMTKVNAFDRSAMDKAFGKIGGLERALQQIQDKTPTGEAVEITDADFAELAEDFPELAGLTMKAIQRVAGRMRGTGASLDPEKIQTTVDERLTAREQTRQEEEMALVSDDYPDWKDIVSSPEFDEWLKQQPPRYQRKLGRSWDADVVSDALDQFKKHKEQAAAPPPGKPEGGETPNTRQQRLKEAVTPRGTGGHAPAPDKDDDFAAGYHSS